MKRKIFSVLFALVLVISFSLIPAVPAAGVANSDGNTLEVSKWTEDVANPIYDPLAKAYYPTVVKVSDTDYRMWYGSDSGVGYATSPDGLTWTEVSNPVSGLTNANHSLVEYIDRKFRIWYWDTGVSIYSIDALRYAESSDGIDWTNDQPLTQDGTYKLITGAGTGWNRGSYGPGDVIYNPSGSNTPDDTNIWNNKYVIYYMATNGGNEYIGLGYSVDGKHWKRYGNNPVLSPCTEADDPNVGWDYRSVGYPTVIKDANGIWHMWFCGGPGANHGIGYAWSNDGISWTKVSNPIFHKDDGVSWRAGRTYRPIVIEDGGIYKMWFSGKDTAASNYAIGYATADGPFPSIQAAINAANSGDTINVATGSYAGFTISKSLTLLGAQANVDAAGSTDRGTPGDGDESVITGMIMITADDVTLNGFKMTSSYVAVGYPHAHNVNISYNILENVTATWGAIHLHGTASGPSYNEADGGYIGYNTISGAMGAGIWTVGNSNVTIEYNHVLSSTGFAAIEALNHVGTGIVIHGNTITNSGGKGINYWAEDGGVITDNVITNATYEAIFTDAQATISGNQIVDAGGYGIFVYFGADGSTVSGNTISSASWEALRILAQATITNNNTTGGYHGVFIGSGASGSIVGGNTISSPNWNGIVTYAPATIMNNDISGSYKGIEVRAASGTVNDGNNIHDNRYWGLSIESGVTDATITNNQFANNPYCGVVVWGAGEGSGININFNGITGNGIYGVESQRTTSDVDAECNWWGDCSGPSEVGTGSGDRVSANVDYDPWLGKALYALKNEIAGLDDDDFKKQKTASQNKETLLDKIDIVCQQIDDGAYQGAIKKLQRDVRKSIEKWIAESVVDDLGLIDMVDAEIKILENFLE